MIAIHSTPVEPVVAANEWTRRCLEFYLRSYRRPGQMYELSGSVSEAEELVAKLGRCWVGRGGYPDSGGLRRWMRNFDRVWTERPEGVAIYHHHP